MAKKNKELQVMEVRAEIVEDTYKVFEEKSLFFWAELEQLRKIMRLRMDKEACPGRGEEYVDLDMEEAREFQRWKTGEYRRG